ncbi:MAG: SGNH/GDSL hydrolase family protein [Arthrobacter sp.]
MATLQLRRRRTVLAAGLVTLAMAAGLAAVPAQAVDKTKYVALGDSYAAGQGAGPYLDDCYRSENTYSELAADAKAIKLVSNSACSGKTTQDVVNAQLRRLNKSTELVTITAGGNNLKVGEIFTNCGAAMANPAAAPQCDAATAFAAAQISSQNLFNDVTSMIQSVKAAAPNAKIVVTGYPYLYDPVAPNPADPLSMFIYKAALLADGLNGSIAAAARVTKVQYVDVTAAFAGHGMLSTDDPWINLDPAHPSSPDNFHPNAEGYEAYFASLSAAGVYSAR